MIASAVPVFRASAYYDVNDEEHGNQGHATLDENDVHDNEEDRSTTVVQVVAPLLVMMINESTLIAPN